MHHLVLRLLAITPTVLKPQPLQATPEEPLPRVPRLLPLLFVLPLLLPLPLPLLFVLPFVLALLLVFALPLVFALLLLLPLPLPLPLLFAATLPPPFVSPFVELTLRLPFSFALSVLARIGSRGVKVRF